MPTPSNDNFANAALINTEVAYTGTLVGSSIEANEYDCWDAQFGPGNTAFMRSNYPYSVWYKLASHGATENVSLFGDDPSAVAVLYIGGNGPGPDSQGNLLVADTLASGGSGSWSFQFPDHIYYVQVITVALVDSSTFTLQVGEHAPPDLSADITSHARASGRLSGLEHINAAVTALGAAHGTLAINTFYVTVNAHGGPRVAVLQLDDNFRVSSYDGDPWTAGGVTVADPPLKNDAVTYPGIALQEAVGATQDTVMVVENLNLLTADAHSNSDLNVLAYARAPFTTYSADTYTYERWIRLRFAEPFNTVQSVRFWSPTDLTGLNAGWDVKWGVTDTYRTPVATASSIATNELPTSDPGTMDYDLLDVPVVDGNETRYSKWLVLQASLTAPTDPGGLLGFTPENSQPVPLELAFAWLET